MKPRHTEAEDLFLDQRIPPRSHTNDPGTSRQAEAHLRDSGALEGQARAILGLCRRHPGRTAEELTTIGAYPDPRTVPRRLSDLRSLGLVRPDGTKRNPVTGRACSLWWPVEVR